jgi:hypothetical protein
MLLVSAGSALAEAPTPGDPPPGDTQQPVFTGPSEVSGWECEPIIGPASASNATSGASGGMPICPDKTRPAAWVYKVEAITGTYDGYYRQSDQVGCIGPCHIGATETQTWTNKFGVSITFPYRAINGAVSYDVTLSSTKSFTWSFDIPSNKTADLYHKDWFHVTNMSVSKRRTNTTAKTYGSAWAGKFFTRRFEIQYV